MFKLLNNKYDALGAGGQLVVVIFLYFMCFFIMRLSGELIDFTEHRPLFEIVITSLFSALFFTLLFDRRKLKRFFGTLRDRRQ